MMVIKHLHPKHKAEIVGKTVPLSKFLWWIRVFIIAVMIFAVLAGFGGWIMYGLYQDVHMAQKQAVQTQQSGHQDRINEDAGLQKQISDAVCTFVTPIPPGASVGTDNLRAKYGCPYVPSPALNPIAPSGTTTKPAAKPSSSPSATHSPLVGPTVSAPGPAVTTTVTTTASAPKPSASTSPPAIINLPKLICLPSGVCL